MELHCAITRLIHFYFIYIWVLIFLVRVCHLLSFNFDCNPPFFFLYRLFDIYEPGLCHLIDCETSLGNLSPSPDPFHPAYEVIRGDTQWLRSNFLWVYCVYFNYKVLLNLIIIKEVLCFLHLNLVNFIRNNLS